MRKEVQEYLTVPENLEAAVHLASVLPEVTLKVHEGFWGGVRDRLAQDVQREGIAALWCAGLSEVDGGNNSWMGISRRVGGEGFGVGASNLAGGPGGCFFGISRGREVYRSEWVPRDLALTDLLAKEGFKSDAWWVGFKYFAHAGVRPLDVLQLNRDNRGDGELAEQVAGLIWELFNGHRAALEDLNQEYPYGKG